MNILKPLLDMKFDPLNQDIWAPRSGILDVKRVLFETIIIDPNAS